MDEKLIEEIDLLHKRVCRGMGDPKRIQILYSLEEKPRYVSELAEELDMPQPTVSRHLKILRDCGLVETERDGTSICYALKDERSIQALELLRGILHDSIRQESKFVESI